MNWKQATKTQLLLIISDHEPCPLYLKIEAKAELMRRAKGYMPRINYKSKERIG